MDNPEQKISESELSPKFNSPLKSFFKKINRKLSILFLLFIFLFFIGFLLYKFQYSLSKTNISKVNNQDIKKVEKINTTIKLIGPIIGDTEVFDSRIVLFGEAETLNDNFTIKVNLNGKRIESNSGDFFPHMFFSNDASRKYFFNFEVDNLKIGENSIEVIAYKTIPKTGGLDDELTKITIRVVRSNSKKIEMTFKDVVDKNIDNEFFFRTLLNANVDQDKPWLYFLHSGGEYGTVNFERYKEHFLGKYQFQLPGNSTIKIKEIGTLEINGKPYNLYVISIEGPGSQGSPDISTFIGYIENNRFVYFSNIRTTLGNNDHPLTFYSSASPYILSGTINDLTSFAIPNSNDFLIPHEDISIWSNKARACFSLSLLEDNKPSTISNSFKIYTPAKYIIEDKYGICQFYRYKASFYKEDQMNKEKNLSNLAKKLSLNLNDGKIIDEFYVPFRFGCAGSSGYNFLDPKNSSYLKEVGKTSNGQLVYVLASNTPYNDSVKYLQKESQDLADEKDWPSFLNNQTIDYPILIINDAFNNSVIYTRYDYLYLPGC